MPILSETSTVDRLRRLQARTRRERVDLYEAGGEDGRGGYGPPQPVEGAVDVAARAMPSGKATEFLASRLVHQDPHAFFFAHDQSLPDDLFVLYDGTLYREEERLPNGIRTLVVAVKQQPQEWS